MRFRFAIVGGGLTATAMLTHFVDRARQAAHQALVDPGLIEIQVFEKKDTFGPGFPHCDTVVLPFHITNMCAEDMGIMPGRSDDFQRWLDRNLQALQKDRPEPCPHFSSPDIIDRPCNHYPRAFMGEYLKNRFHEAVEDALALGIQVDLYRGCEVTDLTEREHSVRLTVKRIASG